MVNNIFDFIREEEQRYSQDIEVLDNWNWNMQEHIRTSILMKHGKFVKATNEVSTKNPYKNIIYPLLNLRYRAEDIDLRDVTLYTENPDKYHLSFLVKKYHDEVYVREHDLDTFFDEVKEEKIDLGGALVRYGANGPVYEPLDSIAFCDQTDILSGPIGFKIFYSPDELLEKKELGWGEEANGADISLEDLIVMAEQAKQQDNKKSRKTDTPGKYIEVYRVHGSFPADWMKENPKRPVKEKFVRQMFIVAFYQNKEGLKTGVTLYKAREYENPFRLHLSGKKIRNRALAYGGVEELFDPQIWTNYSEIRKKDMLDAASKVILQTNDDSYSNRNQIRDMDNLEITVVREGAEIKQVPNGSPNIQLFNEWIQEWDVLGQTTSGATEALLGKTPSSGTPFRLEALVTQNGMALHDYRRGKFATFIEQIYTERIIPDIAKEISSGATFLASLSPDEMEYVANCLARQEANKFAKTKILNGETVTQEEMDFMEQKAREEFARGGTKKFLKILKGEFDGVAFAVKVNVAGKQKDLVAVVDKMVNVFRQVFANPQMLDNPKAAKVFNKLIEYSGLDPIDFGYAAPQSRAQQEQQAAQATQAAPTPRQPATV